MQAEQVRRLRAVQRSVVQALLWRALLLAQVRPRERARQLAVEQVPPLALAQEQE